MKTATRIAAASLLLLPLSLLSGSLPVAAQETPRVKVLATTTDLAALAREVGGDAVEVSCLMTGPEDPHFLDARPSFARRAHDADLFVKTGMDLEIGYEVPIVRDARNPKIQPGTAGYCDASVDVDKLEVPAGVVDRSRGDVHAAGNPHYLTDPVRAAGVASTIAASLGKVDPPRAKEYVRRAEEFGRRVDEALFGKGILEKAPARRLARLLSEGRLAAWLKEKGLEGELGGWAKDLLPASGGEVVAYHSSFLYLLDRFHLGAAAYLEPKPGVPPSPAHLRTVAETMKARKVPAVLCAVFNPKDVPAALAAETGAKVVVLEHVPGALGKEEDYLAFVDRNVKALAEALRGAGR